MAAPGSSQVVLLDPRIDPEPPGWEDYLRRENLTALWSYAGLRAVSESSFCPVLLAVFRDGEQIIGSVGAVYRGILLRQPHRRREPLVLDVRLPGSSHGPTWHFSDGVEGRDALMRAFEREAVRTLGLGLAGLVYRNVTEKHVALVARRGAHVQDSGAATHMTLRWDDAAGWSRSLGRSRAAGLRRRARSFAADPGLEVALGPRRTDLDPEQMADLVRRQTERLQGRFDRRSPPPASYFANLLRRDDVSFLSYVDVNPPGREHGNRRLLAFGTMFHHPTCPLLSWWASLRPEEGGRKHVYFDSYRWFVGRAIETGCQALAAGRGMLDIKVEMGYEPMPMKRILVPRWVMG